MKGIVVVGSGASAVHFALSALEKGHEVLMLDVGRQRPAPVMPHASLAQLKETLDDPVSYFLGQSFEAVLLPGSGAEYYGIPPSKGYVFEGVPQHQLRSEGFAPLSSFAKGGLAEAWTAGSYPFNDAELEDFPFGYQELAPYYDLVARRIGVSGAVDDLARFMPVHQHLLPALDLDEHSRVLAARYERQRARLNAQLRCYVGRSRVAALSQDKDGRPPCTYLGRCLWGCPSQSIYTPSLTLEDCRRYPGFRYRTGVYAHHFTVNRAGRITSLVVETLASRTSEQVPVEILVLAAGTLSSSRIFLESVHRETGELVTLHGLMDNQQLLMPFVNLGMLRKRFNPSSYQYHQLGMGFDGVTPKEYIHGQITTLKTALIHPLIQNMPLDLKTSLALFRNVHAALGLVNINLHDTRRDENGVRFEPGTGGEPGTLVITYTVGAPERARIDRAMRLVRRALRSLNCIVPPGMTRIRPIGASVHYAGLLPMSVTPRPWTTTPSGRSHDFENLVLADGITFPFLPAKNLTFTLMANAARIADQALSA
jgi:choline dehydrogenase-like flavoprotein